jgi:peptidyl-prolyl cis-trans isomerase A (cyclophilin A)
MRFAHFLSVFFGFALMASCKPADESLSTSAEKKPAASAGASTVKVKLTTNHGEIVLELDAAKAPITVENFRSYVDKKQYDGTAFHRVIDGFMIQGGGFSLDDGQLVEKPTGPTIRNESNNGLRNLRGTVAMARKPDPDSATAQFFINVNDNSMLDYPNHGGYTVFGKVTKGMEVVDKIKSVSTGTGTLRMRHPSAGQLMSSPAQDIPNSPVLIESAVIVP